jgi:hypothetical protein
MTITHFEAIMGGIAAVITMLSVLAAGLRWIYRQGVSSQKLVNAIDANTEATARLSDSYGKFTEKTGSTLIDHEQRITRVADKVDVLGDLLRAMDPARGHRMREDPQ